MNNVADLIFGGGIIKGDVWLWVNLEGMEMGICLDQFRQVY